jgi:hypothetical protein
MQADGDISQSYARAFAARVHMLAFHAALGAQPSWKLAARILARRFDLAFGFFLDAPTPGRLANIVAFEAETVQIAERVPALAHWRRPGPA